MNGIGSVACCPGKKWQAENVPDSEKLHNGMEKLHNGVEKLHNETEKLHNGIRKKCTMELLKVI